MNSIAPQDIWRSEAFAEDLAEESPPRPRATPRPMSTALLCALPVVFALIGGVTAFFHTIG